MGLGVAPKVALSISHIHKYATPARGLRFLSSLCLKKKRKENLVWFILLSLGIVTGEHPSTLGLVGAGGSSLET